MLPFIRNFLPAMLFLAFIADATAGAVSCAGTVEKLAFHTAGRLMIKLNSMNTPAFICSTDSDWIVAGTGYTTTPAACKALYATFLTAKATGGSISLIFDGDQVPTACNTWPVWGSANVRYFDY